MKQRSAKSVWRAVALFVMLSAAFFVSGGAKAYAQPHGLQSGSPGHFSQGSRGFHGGAVYRNWGILPHGFAYGGGHRGNWSPSWGHGRYGYAPYGSLHSSGPWFYAYPPGPYPLYVYPRGHRPRYYFPRSHRPSYYGEWHSQRYYYGHH
jgi:hypothetical protein